VSQELLWLRSVDSRRNRGKENSRWKPLPEDLWKESRLRTLSTCCNETKTGKNRNSAKVNRNYQLLVSNRSGFQCKRHLQSLTLHTWQCFTFRNITYYIPWPKSARELHLLSDRCLSAKLLPCFAVGGCHVDTMTEPYGSNFRFIDRSRYFFFK
jgi:hypothetical protein